MRAVDFSVFTIACGVVTSCTPLPSPMTDDSQYSDPSSADALGSGGNNASRPTANGSFGPNGVRPDNGSAPGASAAGHDADLSGGSAAGSIVRRTLPAASHLPQAARAEKVKRPVPARACASVVRMGSG